MKKLLLISIFVFMVYNLFPDWVEITENTNKNLFDHISNELSQTEIRFSLNGYEIKNINANGKNFSRISYTDEGEFVEVGKPDLPRFTRLIAIPDEGEVSFEIIGLEDEIIPEMNIYPRQSLEDQPRNNEFVINEEYYKNGEIFPLQVVELGTPAILRDCRLVSVTINPFQYDPRTKELRIIQNIDVKVNTSGTGGENIRSGDRKISRFFEPLYESVILNYDSTINRDDEYQDPSYLFIYPDNEDVEDDLEMLVDWKHQKGFEVTAVSTAITGSDLASIKNYIQNAYDNWTNPPEFVCLVADGNGSFIIPSGYLSGGYGDQEYARLDGNDILADVFMGRLAYNTITEFRTIIAKILNYERQPYMGSTNWYTDVLLVGDPSSSGQSTIIISKYIKELITNYDNSFTFDEVYSYPFVSSIESSLNSGVCLFNYRGYLGMSGWGNSNTNALSNGYMLPFVMMLTCATGDFTSGECRSEYFLKAGSPSAPKGAIGAVGTATVYTHSCFNNCVNAGTFHGIFGDGIYQMGGALNMGKLNLYINYPNNPDNKVYKFSYWNNLMGDPGLELWTGAPQTLNVTYDPQVALGTNYLEVTVENILNEPVQGAWVTALMGNDDIFVTGFTDENGEVFLPVQASVTGTADLTVTCHNFIPHLGSFTVAQDDVFLNVYGLIIDDDDSGSSSGNNDGNINPGEDIELKVRLKNYGSQTAYSVTSELSSNNQFITVTDNYETWENISSGTSSFCNDDFDFTVPEYVLGGTELDFDITIQGTGREQWLDKIYLTVEGPNLIINNIQIVDGNNGILDPGETAEIVFTIENIGSVQVSGIEGIFRCSDRRITLLDSTGYFGTILPGNVADNSSNTFEVTADNQIIPGSQLNCTLLLSNIIGFSSEVNFILEVGEVNQFDPLGPDEYGYYMYDDSDSGYSEAPVYMWYEIDPSYGGSGTDLNLSDAGNTGDIDDVILPPGFIFVFYGQVYNDITVCSNGWIAPGGSEMYSFMNWHIPGPLVPSPLIAPFWDDLTTSSGKVCYYYDSSQHRFIIEWSRVRNEFANDIQTFQIILYDLTYYPTGTGDSQILFQYQTVHNTSVGYYPSGTSHNNHGQYTTVGIVDHTGTIGLEYTYNNTYPGAAKPLEDEMAILITTDVSSVVEPPEAVINQDSFNFTLLPDGNDSSILEISNIGEANLVYTITKDYVDSREIVIDRDAGGPDNFGYEWIDSNEPGGPIYDWVDISSVGTELYLSDDDYEEIALPFTFSFYGNEKNSIKISSNGYLTFGNDGTDWTNNPIPNSEDPDDFIAPMWDDLKPIGGGWGTVYYYSDIENDRFIVEYFQASHWHSSTPQNPETFEVILYPNGRILFQYHTTTGESDTTIGIENAAGNDGLEVVYWDGSYLENNLTILFKTVADWVELSSQSGIIESGFEDQITITVSSIDLELGDYLCNLMLSTNDPEASLMTIPVNLSVVSQILYPPENVVIYIIGSHELWVYIGWDVVTGADSYNVYASNEPHLPFESWELVASGIVDDYWLTPVSENYKFYKVVSVLN